MAADPSDTLMLQIMPAMTGIKLDTMTVVLGCVGVLIILIGLDKLKDALHIQERQWDAQAQKNAYIAEKTSEYREQYRERKAVSEMKTIEAESKPARRSLATSVERWGYDADVD